MVLQCFYLVVVVSVSFPCSAILDIWIYQPTAPWCWLWQWVGEILSWALPLGRGGFVTLELAAGFLASLSSYVLHGSNSNDSLALSVVDCKALMNWQFESQLLSWCSLHYTAWQFSWPVIAPVGGSSWRRMRWIENRAFCAQTGMWLITRSSWSHLM